MQKILLYYRFAPLADPEVVRLWQKTLCEQLNLKGRILISKHGLNGTVGGELDDLKAYVKATKSYEPMKGITFKWSDGARDDFPRLSVRVRPEVVTFGVPDEIKVDDHGVVGGIPGKAPDEIVVDLDPVLRMVPPPGQRGEARAEVIEDDANAKHLEVAKRAGQKLYQRECAAQYPQAAHPASSDRRTVSREAPHGTGVASISRTWSCHNGASRAR